MLQIQSTPAPRRPSKADAHRCSSCYSLGVSRAIEGRSKARSWERQSTFFLFEDGEKALSTIAAAPGLQIASQAALFDKARHTSLQCDSISCEPHLHKQAKPGVLFQNKVLIRCFIFSNQPDKCLWTFKVICLSKEGFSMSFGISTYFMKHLRILQKELYYKHIISAIYKTAWFNNEKINRAILFFIAQFSSSIFTLLSEIKLIIILFLACLNVYWNNKSSFQGTSVTLKIHKH